MGNSKTGEHSSMVVVAHKDKVLAQIPVGEDPRHLAVDKRRGLVYVANRLDGSMSVIRGTEVITTLSTGGGPTNIAVDERRGYGYVSNADSHSIAVFGFDEAADRIYFVANLLIDGKREPSPTSPALASESRVARSAGRQCRGRDACFA